MRRTVFITLGVAVLLAALATAYVLGGANNATPAVEWDTVVAQDGVVQKHVVLVASAAWPVVASRPNLAEGTITSVGPGPGSVVSDGETLFSVDLYPVLIATGAVPDFRDLGVGSQGEDVEQLQLLLARLGYQGVSADGEFGVKTEAAVKAWQTATGSPVTGVVPRGSIVYVPTLPAPINYSRIPAVGEVASAEHVVELLGDVPDFWVTVQPEQLAQFSAGTAVTVSTSTGESWEATVADTEVTTENGVQSGRVALSGANGSVCGDECDAIPAEGTDELTAMIALVEPTSGVTVPSAALATDAEGAVFVVREDGSRVDVEIAASADGVSVVTGIESGTRVRIPPIVDSE